jgi:LacI family transcriptional regulator
LEKKVTSRDVAKAAGVSQAMVSLVLNNVPGKKIKPETREHILAVAKQMNYAIDVNARNMKSGKAGAIGLLSFWDESSFVFPPIIKGIQAVCSENDLGVVICSGKEDSNGNKDYINYYHQNRINALIYVSYVGVTYEGVISELEENGIPFVCIIGARDIPGISCVDTDFIENGYMAGRHLLEMGYHNMAFLLPNRIENMVYAEKERYEGCRAAISRGGKDITAVDSFIGISEEDSLLHAAEEMLRTNRFDAVISCSYQCFIILKAAARLGIKVPETLGVISLDNEVYAPFLYPSLTTIDEPLYDIAVNAMNILLEKMRGKAASKKVEIAPHLTIRESTKRR